MQLPRAFHSWLTRSATTRHSDAIDRQVLKLARAGVRRAAEGCRRSPLAKERPQRLASEVRAERHGVEAKLVEDEST